MKVEYSVTTGDGRSRCDCNLHRCEPAVGIAPQYRVLVLTTSVIAPGLSIEFPLAHQGEERCRHGYLATADDGAYQCAHQGEGT